MSPLSGCRVLDLGIITAGAATSAILADFGAEVIKVESPSYRDPFRHWLSAPPAGAPPDLPPFFRATNRNKLGISLDLKRERGREVFLRLVRASDIVVENFRRGVLEKLDLAYPRLCEANPAIILASVSSQGETGPDARYVSYGSTLEAIGGLAWTTGYQDGGPTVSGVDLNYPDQVAALFASAMIVTAWHRRLDEGVGAHLDISQRELTSYLSGEAFVAAAAGASVAPTGNAQEPYLIQDCFLTADGEWLAVTVERAGQGELASVLGPEASTTDPARLRQRLRSWVSARTTAAALDALSDHRIAAAVVLDGRGVMAREGRTWSDALQRSPSGAIVKGFALQWDREPMTITREAPAIGADTEDVLRRIARLSSQEIDALLAAGVIEVARPVGR